MTKYKPPKPTRPEWNGSGYVIVPTTKVTRRRPGTPPKKSGRRSPYDRIN